MGLIQVIKTTARRENMWILLVIAAVKFLLFLLVFIAFPLFSGQSGADHVLNFTADIWSRWDAINYQRLANHWYLPTGDERNLIVYYPLYPLLTRITNYAMGDIKVSALLVANLASLAGLLFFYRLARLNFEPPGALTALAALMLFPTSYFFNAPYTEGLFLLTGVASFYAARRQKWLLAGVTGGLAALTRVTGLALIPALLVEFYLQWRSKRSLWPQAFFLLLIPLFFSWYLYLNYSILGDPFAFSDIIKNHWYKEFSWPWQGMQLALNKIGQFPFSSFALTHGVGEFAAGIFLLVLSIFSVRRLRFSYAVFIIAVTCLVLSTSYLMSTPRYILSAFPLFLVFGNVHGNSWWFRLGLLFSIMLLSLFTIQYTRGWWAF